MSACASLPAPVDVPNSRSGKVNLADWLHMSPFSPSAPPTPSSSASTPAVYSPARALLEKHALKSPAAPTTRALTAYASRPNANDFLRSAHSVAPSPLSAGLESPRRPPHPRVAFEPTLIVATASTVNTPVHRMSMLRTATHQTPPSTLSSRSPIMPHISSSQALSQQYASSSQASSTVVAEDENSDAALLLSLTRMFSQQSPSSSSPTYGPMLSPVAHLNLQSNEADGLRTPVTALSGDEGEGSGAVTPLSHPLEAGRPVAIRSPDDEHTHEYVQRQNRDGAFIARLSLLSEDMSMLPFARAKDSSSPASPFPLIVQTRPIPQPHTQRMNESTLQKFAFHQGPAAPSPASTNSSSQLVHPRPRLHTHSSHVPFGSSLSSLAPISPALQSSAASSARTTPFPSRPSSSLSHSKSFRGSQRRPDLPPRRFFPAGSPLTISTQYLSQLLSPSEAENIMTADPGPIDFQERQDGSAGKNAGGAHRYRTRSKQKLSARAEELKRECACDLKTIRRAMCIARGEADKESENLDDEDMDIDGEYELDDDVIASLDNGRMTGILSGLDVLASLSVNAARSPDNGVSRGHSGNATSDGNVPSPSIPITPHPLRRNSSRAVRAATLPQSTSVAKKRGHDETVTSGETSGVTPAKKLRTRKAATLSKESIDVKGVSRKGSNVSKRGSNARVFRASRTSSPAKQSSSTLVVSSGTRRSQRAALRNAGTSYEEIDTEIEDEVACARQDDEDDEMSELSDISSVMSSPAPPPLNKVARPPKVETSKSPNCNTSEPASATNVHQIPSGPSHSALDPNDLVDCSDAAAVKSLPHPIRTFPPSMPIHREFPLFYRKFPVISHFAPNIGDVDKCRSVAPPNASGSTYNPPRNAFDLYTPRFVKGIGRDKEGLCPICFESVERGGDARGLWLAMKFSAFNYHMQNAHGISPSSALPFSPPVEFRLAKRKQNHKNEKAEILEGLCHKCDEWAPMEGVKCVPAKLKEIYWWKHAGPCHRGSTMPGESDIFIDDELSRDIIAAFETGGSSPSPSSAVDNIQNFCETTVEGAASA